MHLVAHPAARRRLLRRGSLARLRAGPARHLPQAPRRDARRAGRVLPARGRVDAARGRPVHLGDAARLHRHRRPARQGAAARSRSRSCPASAAYVDGRGGSSMRLNFSGVDADEIVEGVRRIGKVVDGADRAVLDLRRERNEPVRTAERGRDARETSAEVADDGLAEVVRLPRASKPRAATRRARDGRRVAVLKGGASLERQVSLRSAARVEDALERLGIERDRDRRRTARSSRPAARGRARRRLRRAARPRRRGRHRAGAARDRRHALHGLGRARLHGAAWTRC